MVVILAYDVYNVVDIFGSAMGLVFLGYSNEHMEKGLCCA